MIHLLSVDDKSWVRVSLPALFALGFGLLGCSDPILIGTEVMDSAVADEEPRFPDGGCTKLECQQVSCPSGGTTSVSGIVYAPNGTLPLYNVIVYVPNRALDDFPPGVTCDTCSVISSGWSSTAPGPVALTDAKGHFTLDKNVPVGPNIPLVMQVGKWRRAITIPMVQPCIDNPVGRQIGGIEHLTRLPQSHLEGDLPKIAITTGGCDNLACIMRKIGIDPVEYAPGPTSGSPPKTAVSFYIPGVANDPTRATMGLTGSPDATVLWNDVTQLKNFDMAIFSSECDESIPATKTNVSFEAVREYLDAGGRLFTTNYEYTWYKYSPDTNLSGPPWSWSGGSPATSQAFAVDTSFAQGAALAKWLAYVSSIRPYNAYTAQPPIVGQLPVAEAQDNVHGLNGQYGLSWAKGADGDPKFVTMDMPSNAPRAQQCGKAVHLDATISVLDLVDTTFPSACNPDVKETELATVFFLFDLSSCFHDPGPTTPIIN